MLFKKESDDAPSTHFANQILHDHDLTTSLGACPDGEPETLLMLDSHILKGCEGHECVIGDMIYTPLYKGNLNICSSHQPPVRPAGGTGQGERLRAAQGASAA